MKIATGGAAPPSTVIAQMEAMGFAVTHLYGLTESYGPSTVCLWQPGLDDLPMEEKAAFMARQGVNTPMLEEAAVLNPATMRADAGGWRDDRRADAARQYGDEGLPEKPRRPPRRPSPVAGSTPATSR